MTDLKEMKRWLLSDESDCILWRNNPANQKDVGAYIDALADNPGGMSRDELTSRLANEKRLLERAQHEQDSRDQAMREFKELKFEEVAKFGVTRETFDRQWPTILQDLMTRGTLETESQRLLNQRRSKAARTF